MHQLLRFFASLIWEMLNMYFNVFVPHYATFCLIFCASFYESVDHDGLISILFGSHYNLWPLDLCCTAVWLFSLKCPGLHYFGGDQKIWWRHHPSWLLRLNPACLAEAALTQTLITSLLLVPCFISSLSVYMTQTRHSSEL